MKRATKQQIVEQLSQTFRENKGLWLVGFQGIKVADVTELRQKVAKVQSHYRVVKKSLALRAAKDTLIEQLGSYFDGPTAIAYTQEDPVALVKVVTEFAREHPEIRFKAGILERALISAEQTKDLAQMPSREELLSKLLFLLMAPLRQLATALRSPLADLASVMRQLGEKREKESGDSSQESG